MNASIDVTHTLYITPCGAKKPLALTLKRPLPVTGVPGVELNITAGSEWSPLPEIFPGLIILSSLNPMRSASFRRLLELPLSISSNRPFFFCAIARADAPKTNPRLKVVVDARQIY